MQYYENNLQDIFNLKQYKLIVEDIILIIEEYLKNENKKFDLNDPKENRKKYMHIIVPENIKFLNEEQVNNYLNNKKMMK